MHAHTSMSVRAQGDPNDSDDPSGNVGADAGAAAESRKGSVSSRARTAPGSGSSSFSATTRAFLRSCVSRLVFRSLRLSVWCCFLSQSAPASLAISVPLCPAPSRACPSSDARREGSVQVLRVTGSARSVARSDESSECRSRSRTGGRSAAWPANPGDDTSAALTGLYTRLIGIEWKRCEPQKQGGCSDRVREKAREGERGRERAREAGAGTRVRSAYGREIENFCFQIFNFMSVE
jgi:hypothetical protein